MFGGTSKQKQNTHKNKHKQTQAKAISQDNNQAKQNKYKQNKYKKNKYKQNKYKFDKTHNISVVMHTTTLRRKKRTFYSLPLLGVSQPNWIWAEKPKSGEKSRLTCTHVVQVNQTQNAHKCIFLANQKKTQKSLLAKKRAEPFAALQ